MDLGLENKRAIVGGASKGLGFACARALLLEGSAVVISSRSKHNLENAADHLLEETGTRPHLVPADLTIPKDRENLVNSATDLLGGVDILVSNTGGPPTGPFEVHDADDWQLAIDLALGSVTHLSRLLLPSMKGQGFGRIVQIVSVAGLEVIDGLILSNASRPAVLGFAKALAREVASHNILINSICPGIFLTDRIKEIAAAGSVRTGISSQQFIENMCSDIPLGRAGDPRELGSLAAFLCSPLNTYISGAAIPIDGARTRRLY